MYIHKYIHSQSSQAALWNSCTHIFCTKKTKDFQASRFFMSLQTQKVHCKNKWKTKRIVTRNKIIKHLHVLRFINTASILRTLSYIISNFGIVCRGTVEWQLIQVCISCEQRFHQKIYFCWKFTPTYNWRYVVTFKFSAQNTLQLCQTYLY